jgi:hypothetical protein
VLASAPQSAASRRAICLASCEAEATIIGSSIVRYGHLEVGQMLVTDFHCDPHEAEVADDDPAIRLMREDST